MAYAKRVLLTSNGGDDQVSRGVATGRAWPPASPSTAAGWYWWATRALWLRRRRRSGGVGERAWRWRAGSRRLRRGGRRRGSGQGMAPLPEEASAAAEPEQDPVILQNEELEGLKAGLEAVRNREQSPQEKVAWWLLRRAVVIYCGSVVGTVAANDPSAANHMLNYDQVFIRDLVPSAIALLLKGESDIVKNFLLHTLQLQVLGKFHPHGDSAVYETLVRMAQDFSMRYPLVQGHGNFGSIDADPPAAMRYTECRLDPLTEAMFLTDLELNTVDYVPNFDNSQKEPSLLPARVPSLLLNGSSGIAVGMATNIPPHNLGELVDALSVIIQNPEATLQELLECMPGPDFPTGGIIMGNDGILDAYRTGRGRVIVRGKTDVETIDEKSKRTAIIIKEIPYQTNKATLVQRIAELVEDKVLEGISDIRDESDRSGMRVVIEVKRGANPEIVLNNLYRHTALQSSFSCNMVAILDGHPKLMGLKEILQAFLDFRSSVIERRAKFKLSQALERKHIVEGIVIGLDNLDSVIQMIRETSNHSKAKEALANEYGLSEKQAEALLDITLRKLTSLERKKFIDESNSLSEDISKLNELLSSKKLMFQLIEQEAADLKNKFATPRRSFLEDSANGEVDDMDVIPNEEMLLIVSEKGYLKRMKPNTFNLQHRGTIGKSVGKMRTNDNTSDFIVCQTHDHVLYFSDKGIVYSARAYKIPECTRNAAGTPLVQLLSLSDGERITSIIPVSEFGEDQYLVMLTINGYIKKVPLNVFSSIRPTGIISIQLVPGDELKWVRLCGDDDLVALASQTGMVIVNTCNKLRALGRKTRGVVAMKLKEDDKMASMDIIPATMHKMPEKYDSRVKDLSPPWLLFIAENGLGKRVPLNAFRQSSFNRRGLHGYKLPEDCRLAAVFVVGVSLTDDGGSDEQVVLISHGGTVNRIKVKDISIQGRGAKGVILMRLEHAGKIQSASLMSATVAEEIMDD